MGWERNVTGKHVKDAIIHAWRRTDLESKPVEHLICPKADTIPFCPMGVY
jgi:hypothetical protein